ncbi:hypothetical protein [Clostridium sp. BNL1100]|uniref:hypothetical protein n=1 Tax=Clostridium sp. BNL1100 TaxID=755731 RepID=UPI00024A7C9A|nr:hypothetical protein [Clostridium sp. BNL1100]AEY65753.1 hypothetical protein Clo1100_1525 [Clostridium sp. BNL1100]
MAESGRVKGIINVKKFIEFVNYHNLENDWYKYVSQNSNKIHRGLICEECGFSKSVIVQNPKLKDEFEKLVQDLIRKGILSNQSSNPTNIDYDEQEIFIKTYKEKIIKFKDGVDNLKKLVTLYSQEINLLVHTDVLKDK